MATIHRATLSPTKLELLAAWLPARHWYPASAAAALDRVGAFRFDDPDGEVGVETFLVRDGADGPLVQVPMTYRGAPLDDGDRWLIGTTEHSVLGTRWVYDAVGDPVYWTTLAHTIRTGGHEAVEELDGPDGPETREPLMRAQGSGSSRAGVPDPGKLVRVEDGDPTVIVTEHERIVVRRVLTEHPADEPLVLTGTWPGQRYPVVLAEVVQFRD